MIGTLTTMFYPNLDSEIESKVFVQWVFSQVRGPRKAALQCNGMHVCSERRPSTCSVGLAFLCSDIKSTFSLWHPFSLGGAWSLTETPEAQSSLW